MTSHEVLIEHWQKGWVIESVWPSAEEAMDQVRELQKMGWGTSSIRCRPVRKFRLLKREEKE